MPKQPTWNNDRNSKKKMPYKDKGPFNIITLTGGIIYIVKNLAEVEYRRSELPKKLRLQGYHRLKFGPGLFLNVPHSKQRVIAWQRWK